MQPYTLLENKQQTLSYFKRFRGVPLPVRLIPVTENGLARFQYDGTLLFEGMFETRITVVLKDKTPMNITGKFLVLADNELFYFRGSIKGKEDDILIYELP